MVVIAVGNGAFRESILRPQFGELRARQLSTLLLIALLAVYVWIIVSIWPIESGCQAAAIGLIWLALTLIFEFALGRSVSGLSWREIAAEYNVAAGARLGARTDLDCGGTLCLLSPAVDHERRRDAAPQPCMRRLQPQRCATMHRM
jgi:hypothetical protein